MLTTHFHPRWPPPGRDDGVEVDIEAPAAMPTTGGALSQRQFRRPCKRIHSNNDLSRFVNRLQMHNSGMLLCQNTVVHSLILVPAAH